MSTVISCDVPTVLEQLAAKLQPLAQLDPAPVMVGIHTGGVWVAEQLHQRLGLSTPLGRLNINFYRDDFARIGLHAGVGPSHIEAPLDGRCVILVDDILHTGRTTRAALNELFDYGRPASVRLVVLADRGGRELPVSPDYVGTHLDLPPQRQIKLIGPESLQLVEQ